MNILELNEQRTHQAAPPISTVLRKAPAVSKGAISRSSGGNAASNGATGMVLHVSNRPTSSVNHNSGAVSKKSHALDFPALPASAKSKKHAPRNPIDEDMLPSGAHIPLSNVSAKHRPLVDDYVSVANASSFQKIQTVQKEELEAKNRKVSEQVSAPKLTSQDFPSLGLGSSSKPNQVQANNWAKGQKQSDKRQRELENRKSKVAPAPLLSKENNNKQSINTTNKKQTQPAATNNKISATTAETSVPKKDKKSKDKKEKSNSDNSNQQQKVNGKSKEKNNNINNNSMKRDQSSTSPTSSLDNGNDNDNMPQVRPPPGFAQSSTNTQPPPGFQSTNVTVNSIAKSPNNLTFTSSFGEKYSIVRTHPYIQPTDAATRNQVNSDILLYK